MVGRSNGRHAPGGTIDEAEAGRRFDKIGAHARANAAQLDLERVAGQVFVLEDHLGQGAVLVGRFDDRTDVCFDERPIFAQHFADVDHHVDFAGPLLNGQLRFETLGFGGRRTVRKADHRADGRIGAGQQFGRQPNGVRLDANRRYVQPLAQLAALAKLALGERGVQERVIDESSNRIVHGFSQRDLAIAKRGDRCPAFYALDTQSVDNSSARLPAPHPAMLAHTEI